MQIHEILVVFSSLLALIALIILVNKKFSLHPVLALLIVAVGVGVINGLDEHRIISAIRTGAADSFGSFGIAVTLGAIFGRLLLEVGVTQRIARSIANVSHPAFGIASIVLISLCVGLPLFFEAGMIILIPIIYAVAEGLRAKAHMETAFTILITSAFATLLTVHGFLPPHPGPTTVSHIVRANIGLVSIVGIAIAIPTVILTGPLYSWCIARWVVIKPTQELNNKIIPHEDTEEAFKQKNLTHHLPVFVCYILLLLPVILIFPATLMQFEVPSLGSQNSFLFFIGNPIIALLISILVMMVITMYVRSVSFASLNVTVRRAIDTVASLVILLSAGGALSRMLFVIGVQDVLEELIDTAAIPVIFLAWALAALVGTASGSATVAATTAAQLTSTLVVHNNAFDHALLVLAIGCGSIFCNYTSHGSYWMVKDTFGLTVRQNTMVVTISSSLISLVGIAFVGILFYLEHAKIT